MFLYICQTETTNLLLTNMKKLFTLAAALLLGASAFAQNQGDMAVKATTFFSYYNSHNKALDISMDGTNFAIGAGFTYFVIDNLGVSLDATYATGNTVALTPSVSYFIPIASNFYYTPTLGLSTCSGNQVGIQRAVAAPEHHHVVRQRFRCDAVEVDAGRRLFHRENRVRAVVLGTEQAALLERGSASGAAGCHGAKRGTGSGRASRRAAAAAPMRPEPSEQDPRDAGPAMRDTKDRRRPRPQWPGPASIL